MKKSIRKNFKLAFTSLPILLLIIICIKLISNGSLVEILNIYRILIFTEGSTEDKLERILDPK